MAQEENLFRRELMETIVSEVINKDESPYKQMMGKVGCVRADYFGSIEMGNTLAEKLNMELKQKVVEHMKEAYEQMMAEKDIVGKVMLLVGEQMAKAKRTMGKDALSKDVLTAANNLKQYAKSRLLFVPEAPCQEEELQAKYEEAKRITLMEQIMQNNEKDVIDFYRTLISRTEWECRVQIERRTSQLLVAIADKMIIDN
jgi:hypothetical protein